MNALFSKAKIAGIPFEQRSVTIEDIRSHIIHRNVILILLNGNLLNFGKHSSKHYNFMLGDTISYSQIQSNPQAKCNTDPDNIFIGHFVVLFGYDFIHDEFFYHDPSSRYEWCTIHSIILEMARKSCGTDEDIIFIYL